MIHFCYIVNGNGRDNHTHMAYVSARFLRAQHPEARVTCLTDHDSAEAIRGCRHPLLSLVDSVVEVEAPEPDLSRKNRWIGTRMRNVLEGDFLYLDSDTICVARLDSLFELLKLESFDIALTRDLNRRTSILSRRLGRRSMWGKLHAMGWTTPRLGYFNKGVALFRDNSVTRSLALRWQDLWKASCATGRHFDQPALNQAIVESQARLRVLPAAYNAQVKYAPLTVFGAKILHLFSSAPETLHQTALGAFVAEVAQTGELSEISVRGFLADPFPWKDRHSLRSYCWECSNLATGGIAINRLMRGRPCFHTVKQADGGKRAEALAPFSPAKVSPAHAKPITSTV
jgi:hypothetical protein